MVISGNTYNFRLERWFYPSFLQLLPLDVPEEGVMFDSLLSSVILKKHLSLEFQQDIFSITFTQPSLLLTFFCIKPLRMDTASLLSQTGYSTSSWRIDSNKSSSLSALKTFFNFALKKFILPPQTGAALPSSHTSGLQAPTSPRWRHSQAPVKTNVIIVMSWSGMLWHRPEVSRGQYSPECHKMLMLSLRPLFPPYTYQSPQFSRGPVKE